MALIRGTRGKCPCPVCLAPDDQLSDFCLKFPERTTDATKLLVIKEYRTKAEREAALKPEGLRPVVVGGQHH